MTSNLSTPKTKSLQNIDICEFLVANNIRTEEELMAKAQQFFEGNEDLKKFILGKSPKVLQDLVTTAWKMEEAATNTRRQQKH